MADVFISYKREERAQVARIAERLQDLGLSVWFDASLDAGSTFHTEINREVRGAKAVLVAWSPAATESPWVLAEAQVGFDGRKLAPAFIAACDLPPPFNGVHTLDLKAWTGSHDDPAWLEMIDQIGRLTGRSGLRHLALAIAAGEPVRTGANEAAAAQARAPKRVAAPKPPKPAKAAQPKRDAGEVAEQVAADTRSGLGAVFSALGRLLMFGLKLVAVVGGGFVSLFVMRRKVLGGLALLGAIVTAIVLIYLSNVDYGGFTVRTCEYSYSDGTYESAYSCDQIAEGTYPYFSWQRFWYGASLGWFGPNGLVAALFILTSWIPRSVREGFVRGFRRRREA